MVHGGENMVEKMSELKKLAKATKAELEVQRCDRGLSTTHSPDASD